MKVSYPRFYRAGKSHKLTAEEIAKMKELRLEGWTQQRIADDMNISYFSVAYHTNENIKKRIQEQAKERYRMMSKEDQREVRNRNMKSKRKRQNIEYRIYRTPDAKFRKISNQEFMKIAATKPLQEI